MDRGQKALRAGIGLVALVAVVVGLAAPQLARSDATTVRPEPCRVDRRPCAENLLVVTRDGLRCAIYQAGGPNSARLWCENLERPGTGAPAAGGGS